VGLGVCQSRASGVGSHPDEPGADRIGEEEDPVAAVGGADVARA
jgi:hypothetical protein